MLRKSVLTFLVLGLNLSFLNSAQALDIDVDSNHEHFKNCH
jgi:hypothetical protein